MLTLDAVMCLLLLAAMIKFSPVTVEPGLNNKLAYQQAQDIVEVCARKEDLNEECFSKLEGINPAIEYGGGEFMFYREIEGETIEISFGYGVSR